MANTYHFVLPSTFHPGEFLRTTKLRDLWDDARYFMSTVLTKTARGQLDCLGVVRLHAKHLRNIMQKHLYCHVIDALLERGAVERFGYTVGQRSFGYRLAKRFVPDKHVRVPVTDPRLIARMDEFYREVTEERNARMLPVHHALDKLQHRLQINGDMAREILASLPPRSNPFDTQGILISDIEHREFHTNVGNYGRLSNNITAMKRELRSTLHVRRDSLRSVDIRCAQPAFLAKLMNERASKDRGKREQGRGHRGREGTREREQQGTYDAPTNLPELANLTFRVLTCSGEFYDFFVIELAKRGIHITRDVLKRKFLSDVIAKQKVNRHGAEYPSAIERCFCDLFPNVYRFIRAFNWDGWQHENLIRELQRQESQFVIGTVASDLIGTFPNVFIITLHDAIYAPPRHIPKVERAFHRAFDRTGFHMALKVETQ